MRLPICSYNRSDPTPGALSACAISACAFSHRRPAYGCPGATLGYYSSKPNPSRPQRNLSPQDGGQQ
jgi:hypothetical protein